MSHEAIIKFAPIFTLERFNDPKWARPGRPMYEPGAFRFGPSEDPFVDKETVPLLIDHDPERESRRCATCGPWVVPSAAVTDVPRWLERGTRVSFGFSSLQTRDIEIRDSRVRRSSAKAIVNEVSVLSPGKKAAELLAEVLSRRPTEQRVHGGGSDHLQSRRSR